MSVAISRDSSRVCSSSSKLARFARSPDTSRPRSVDIVGDDLAVLLELGERNVARAAVGEVSTGASIFNSPVWNLVQCKLVVAVFGPIGAN